VLAHLLRAEDPAQAQAHRAGEAGADRGAPESAASASLVNTRPPTQ
jgi:hypothetical protein